jgi:hypothetical protein
VSAVASRLARVRAALVAVRLGYGLLLVLVPATALPTDPGDRAALAVARLLGARHLAQGVIAALAPHLLTPRRGALVDGTHAVSMVGWAALDDRHRRPALLDAASAGVLAAAVMAAAGMGAARPSGVTLPR